MSNNSVWAITQDKQGFIWIGTADGLNRYDGEHCIVYRYSADSTGLSDNMIWSLLADSDGSLWVGTNSGLNRFDPSTKSFRKYPSSNAVRSIYRDRGGVLWVGTARGLNRFENGTWTRYLPTPDDSARPGDNFINVILEDSRGSFWVGAGHYRMGGGGVYQFDRINGTFSRVRYSASEPTGSSVEWITSLSEDASGVLWICADSDGLNKFDES